MELKQQQQPNPDEVQKREWEKNFKAWINGESKIDPIEFTLRTLPKVPMPEIPEPREIRIKRLKQNLQYEREF